MSGNRAQTRLNEHQLTNASSHQKPAVGSMMSLRFISPASPKSRHTYPSLMATDLSPARRKSTGNTKANADSNQVMTWFSLPFRRVPRSEEHTSELQSLRHLV